MALVASFVDRATAAVQNSLSASVAMKFALRAIASAELFHVGMWATAPMLSARSAAIAPCGDCDQSDRRGAADCKRLAQRVRSADVLRPGVVSTLEDQVAAAATSAERIALVMDFVRSNLCTVRLGPRRVRAGKPRHHARPGRSVEAIAVAVLARNSRECPAVLPRPPN